MTAGWGWEDWVRTFVPLLPVAGAFVVGLILALVHWRRAPRAARLVLVAVLLMGGSLAASYVFSFLWIDQQLNGGNWSPNMVMWGHAAVSFMTWAIHAVGLFLLFLAAFSNRSRAD